MVRRKKLDKGGEELVSCNECGRLVYLDETDFESLAQADEGSLVCRICEKFEEGFKLMEGECAARVEEVKRELKVERGKRVVLETQVEVLAKREEFKIGLQELIREEGGKVERMVGDHNEERKKRVELERQVEELIKREAWKSELEQRKRECEDRVGRLAGVVNEEKGKSEEGQAKVVEVEGRLRTKVERRADLESQWEELKRKVAEGAVAEGPGLEQKFKKKQSWF